MTKAAKYFRPRKPYVIPTPPAGGAVPLGLLVAITRPAVAGSSSGTPLGLLVAITGA